MSSGPHGLTAGDKFALATLAIVGIFGDAFYDAAMRLDWGRLAVFAAVAASAMLLTVGLCLANVASSEPPSRTEYLSRSDDERAPR